MKIKTRCRNCQINVYLEKKDIKIKLWRRKGYVFDIVDSEYISLFKGYKEYKRTYKLKKDVAKETFKCIGCNEESHIYWYPNYVLINKSKLIKEEIEK